MDDDNNFEETLQVEIKKCNDAHGNNLGMFALRNFQDKEIITIAVAEEKLPMQDQNRCPICC